MTGFGTDRGNTGTNKEKKNCTENEEQRFVKEQICMKL